MVERRSSSAVPQGITGGLSRRRFLQGLTAGGVTLAAGAALAACQRDVAAPGDDGVETVDVTLLTADWPYGPMPSPEVQEDDPVQAAYAEALAEWQEENPGVELREVSFNVWGQDDLVTGVAGGTAPSFIPGNVLGGWNDAASKTAFVQGLAADVTELNEQYGFRDKIIDIAREVWDTWETEGRYYGVPDAFNVGNGIYYRRDLIREFGLVEPEPGWTWDDFRELARGYTEGGVTGAAMQQWGIGWGFSANGGAFSPATGKLTVLPDPDGSWHWQWDFTSMAERWEAIIQRYRAMMFDDESIMSDITFTDPDVVDAWRRGDAAMHPNNAGFMTSVDTVAMEQTFGMPLDELVGWIPHPVGDEGLIGNTYRFTTVLSFDPDLDEVALDKAVSLHDFMLFGPAYERRRAAVYEATGDLRRAFDAVTPINGIIEIDGVGSIDEAWGPHYLGAVEAAGNVPLRITDHEYMPIEEASGPGSDAWDDATSRWSYERGALDYQADLQNLENTLNRQAAGFSSTVPKEEFLAAAREYYEANDTYFREHSPEFHAEVWQPFYEAEILPRIQD